MNRFAENIRRIRFEHHMTQEEFATLLGTTKQNISRYESGAVSPKISTAQAIADRLGITLSELNGDPVNLFVKRDGMPTDFSEVIKVLEKQMQERKPVSIPVLGAIPAGIPLEAIEEILDYEEIPGDWARGGKEYFALKIHGSSMSPRYEDGDVVIFRRSETCESGQDCAVMVNGDDATFKRVRLTDSGMMLQAINPEYDSYIYTAQQVRDLPVRIIGVAVELRRKF